MDSEQPHQDKLDNEVYLRIWELEQEHTRTRWTVTTFFLSVSFAIFGFSFQAQLSSSLSTVARISGLAIYWFAYLLFLRFNEFTNFLRGYLMELERTKRTDLDMQSKALKAMSTGSRRLGSATKLMFYFGLLYTISVGLLWWLVS
jgi:hypothetical protein